MATEIEFAQEAVKQVLGLSSGILGLSLTFSKDFAGGVRADERWPLYVAWSLLGFCVLAGVVALLTFTGSIRKVNTNTMTNNWIRIPWLIQLGTFVGGFGFLVAFAIAHLPS